MMATENWAKLKETRKRLEKCWKVDLDWSLYPSTLKEGCVKVGKALNLPPTAVLCGYLILGSYVLSPAVVEVPDTDWSEPILLWLTVCMPTGSGKSTLFRHLIDLLRVIKKQCGVCEDDPAWLVDDSSFEKMGSLMYENSGRLLGLYDELAAFLSQIRLYRGGGLSESHELALFLQLFNGHHWRRDTVTGEANFNMDMTRLTIGGFTQPGVARHLIELPSNTEKGLSHRFLWLFPKPLYGEFDSLGKIDKDFTDQIVKLFSEQWRIAESGEELGLRVFKIPESSAGSSTEAPEESVPALEHSSVVAYSAPLTPEHAPDTPNASSPEPSFELSTSEHASPNPDIAPSTPERASQNPDSAASTPEHAASTSESVLLTRECTSAVPDDAPQNVKSFGQYYNETQAFLKTVSGLDPLLEGLMSKNRGLVLRVATVLHLLFHVGVDESVADEVSNEAITAAINVIQLTCQQTAFMVGRGPLEEELLKYQPDNDKGKEDDVGPDNLDTGTATFCLLLPGKTLYLSHLLALKKFRNKGNKDGAVKALCKLEDEKLGELFEVGGSGSNIIYEFEKVVVPEDKKQRVALSKKLQKYNVSLTQYIHVLKQRSLKPYSSPRGKRPSDSPDPPRGKIRKIQKSPQSTPTKKPSDARRENAQKVKSTPRKIPSTPKRKPKDKTSASLDPQREKQIKKSKSTPTKTA